jgi:hypothetical protein
MYFQEKNTLKNNCYRTLNHYLPVPIPLASFHYLCSSTKNLARVRDCKLFDR